MRSSAPASSWRRPWAAWRAHHLHDYAAPAARLWGLLALAGAAALLWTAQALWRHPPGDWQAMVAGLLLIGWLAWHPVQVPRSHRTVLVADVFVYLMLAHLGTAPAVLAAGVEAFLGALRTSRRWSTRISGPATAMAAMLICGALYERLLGWMLLQGVQGDVAMLASLCLVSIVPAVLTTAPLMAMIAMKTGGRLRLGQWFDDAFWFIVMVLAAAFIAALVEMNARRTGLALLAVVAVLALTTVVLLRHALARIDLQRAAQEAALAGAQAEAQAHQQRFTAAFTHAAVGMAIVGADGRVLQANRALAALLQQTEAGLVGQRLADLLDAGDAERLALEVAKVRSGLHGAMSMELRCRTPGDDPLWVTLHCSRYADPVVGGGDCLIVQLHDITSRRVAESRLHHIAYHDGLTDLANRHCFHERLQAAVLRSAADATQRFAVIFLDLDRFKIVNDSLGHEAGNQLLREVGERLRKHVRPADLVARLGGDEFAVLLEGLSEGMGEGLAAAQRLLASLSVPVRINGTEVVPGASVGITFSELGLRSAGEVLRDADLAMYEAKGAGRGRVAVFDHTMHDRVAEKLALEADLRHAIGEGQLNVHFQPLYQLEPYQLTGFEALARWTHPRRGVVSPAVFVALAEETGHIEALTDWVIDHAVGQLGFWERQHPEARGLGMHINISGRDLARPTLVPLVMAVLERHGVAPQQLTLEITETTLMGKLETALDALRALRAHGVRVAIDDFGTGYSSLAYLSTLPINSLKIDRSFVMGLTDKPGNAEIIRAVLNLGRSLGHKVVAEGIETVGQLTTLRDLGVDVGQGYLLARPLRTDQVLDLLALSTHAIEPA
jgi:diguanylate cyclase (GGDEF)-like protein/PAS domain S-box-containing protein